MHISRSCVEVSTNIEACYHGNNMKENLYRISQVANFLSTTTTALRYYEAEGLLSPVFVDPITKYRYYDIANINTVSYILALRDAGATMMQIKSYFANQSSMQLLLDNLVEQHKKLQKKIDFFQDVFNSSKTSYTVKQIVMPAVSYISSNYIATDIPHAIKLVESFVANAVTTCTLTASPATFIEYNTLDFDDTDFPIIIGIEVDSAIYEIKTRQPQRAIRVVHHGSYSTLPLAYEELFNYAYTNELELVGNVYEYYHESFNLRLDPDDYVTEVIMPLKQ